ncbi:hypothetical protein [Streptomyces sp. NPDC047718]|uniref:hypothetical protein n=1 Tax=Streptomyces sp. NPDC047718 TaxID=3155479 RepID=UPI0033DEEC80
MPPVLGPQQPAPLEDGEDLVDEVGEPGRQDRGHDGEPVGGTADEPFLQLVGDLLGRPGVHAVAAPGLQPGDRPA